MSLDYTKNNLVKRSLRELDINPNKISSKEERKNTMVMQIIKVFQFKRQVYSIRRHVILK